MLFPISAVRNFVIRLDHPEGLAAGRDGTLYAGGEAGQVYRISPDGKKVDILAKTGGFCLGITLDQEENIYVCDLARRAVLKATPRASSPWLRILPMAANSPSRISASSTRRAIFTSVTPGAGSRPMGRSIAWIAAGRPSYSRQVLFISPMGWRLMRQSNTSIWWRATWTAWCVLKSSQTAVPAKRKCTPRG